MTGAGMESVIALRCPRHGTLLAAIADQAALACDKRCRFPVIHEIPRFVSAQNYAAGFGLQWLRFAKTQLDSHTGTTISRDRLTRCLGGDLGVVRGKLVLEAGCGAGRFTEVLLDGGARVVSFDLSRAVEANHANFRGHASHCVFQADISTLPLAPGSFDLVICLGVIQHTPDPERTIAALAEQVKPGGMLVVDHYTHGYETPVRRVLRKLVLTLPASLGSRATLLLARMLLPLHRLFWRAAPLAARVRARLARWSPLVDYYDAYPGLKRSILVEWCVLDTHDTLTDVYKHLRSVEEIRAAIEATGLRVVAAGLGGNGIEARGVRPLEDRCAA